MVDIKIGVDADDATRSVAALQEVFAKFAAASEKQSAVWGGVADETKALGTSVEGLHATMLGVADGLQLVLDQHKKLEDSAGKTARHWQFFSRHTKQFASHIKDATESILKWAGIGGLIVGAAGFGAEHALFDMAANVGARRSTALGLNTTYGGLASARVNYARFGDADSALGNIAAAQNDPSKRLGLQNLGVANDGRDSADVLADAMDAVKRLLDRKPANVGLAQYSQNMHLDEVFSTDSLQRLQNSSDEEVHTQSGKLRSDRKGLDLAPDVQRKWQDLSTQLSKAGTAIETVLVNRLVALEPGLQKLSEAFTKAADTVLAKDGPAAQWLDELGKGLDSLAKWLEDPASEKKISDFLDQVGEAAKYVWDVGKKALELLHWLAQLTGTDASTDAAAAGGGGVTSLTPGGGIELSHGGATGLRERARELSAPKGYGRSKLGGGGDASRGSGGGAHSAEVMKGLEDQLREEGVAPEHLHAAAAALMGNVVQESGADPTKVHDHGTGYGIYGARLDRRDKMLGWLAEHKYAQNSAEGQGRYMAHEAMSKRYGQTANALRNATRDNLGDVTNTVATNFESPAPATANYGGRRNNAMAAYGRPPAAPAKVTVSTNPGGNPHVAAAAAAAPQ